MRWFPLVFEELTSLVLVFFTRSFCSLIVSFEPGMAHLVDGCDMFYAAPNNAGGIFGPIMYSYVSKVVCSRVHTMDRP